MTIGPAPIVALFLGLLHVSLYVLIRGSAGARVPVLILAAWLGAWAGDGIGDRIGLGILVLGDFHLVPASVVAWIGIAVVVALATVVPGRRGRSGEPFR